jgi:glycosyltransferase involved in cell wall biosynthesis
MVSIIVPVYNEGSHIYQFITGFIHDLRSFKFFPCELILVNDGSNDNSQSEITKAIRDAGSIDGLKVGQLTHSKNCGYGSAIKTGIKQSHYKNCAIIDSDSTYHLEDLVELYQKFINENYDMVVGTRSNLFDNEKFLKRFLRKVLKWLTEYMASSKIPDLNSGLRIFNKSRLIGDEFLLSNRFSFTSTITLLFLLRQNSVGYFPISYSRRKGSSKVRIFRDGVTTVGQMITLAAFLNPMKLLFPALSACFILILFSTAVVLFNSSIIILLYFLLIFLFNLICVFSIGLHVLGLYFQSISKSIKMDA